MDAETLITISQQLAALAEGLRDGNLAGPPQAITSADLPVRLIHTRADLLQTFDSMIDRAVHSIDAFDRGERPRVPCSAYPRNLVPEKGLFAIKGVTPV
ncbi:hypothetical protein [Glutamicibacter nicotianae]|uniref:hypothetical protein n=1 Tax=Glutamicibacter nicotianae TaxID=37929 RepID=UPI0013CED3E7|nr:hypothetical protein [Glutamicibacter nicotianae]